ncbi:ankyrin repeat domain-containing protein [Jeotgalibacillus salarius]|uniref:Ankyrin repeat domain-containing protein n=1 Tax=Jeotgalibacillus salarius TaxID=546023 RepID=A0A4Y8LER5_9BACL|nr:ankyrin repeat domain-containing protein [Jeotgalibacillus salarius]TFE01009.1 ankyrin repeat domain-containing protein [Jeotgalibacillus salarius]
MSKKWIIILSAILLVIIILTVFYLNEPKEIDNEALFESIASGDQEAVSELIEEGQALNIKGENGMTAFQTAISYQQPDIAKMLLSEGAEPVEGDAWLSAQSMIDPAIDEDNLNEKLLEIIKEIHSQKSELISDVNAQDETLLFEAIRLRHEELFNWLHNQGLNTDVINASGETIFHSAARFPYSSLSFITDEADYSGGKTNIDGDTPLLIAVKSNHTEWIKEFLKTDDVNTQNEAGWTPLMFAADYGFTESAQVLMELGADPELQNDSGESALDIALKYDNKALIALLNAN